ncbi:MAG: SMC family ATPase [Candidatus Poseidoniaceae archaeon]|nr:SMC family ATPase [Candidatus Poseidoniaceae archaeon]
MKILRIRMENFGPYVDETIDFTELNKQRLFLLEGKTGCGKSTVIEGVVFALYGKDSKGRTEGVRRNSASTKQNTTVTLDFEVDGVTYRVVRSPQRTDPETGKPKPAHKVNLAEIDSDGNVIAGRTWDAIQEVGRRITSIIRLNANQFTRIVVLPQGQFSKFLRSKSEDRQALLEAIFPIDDWKEIQKRIKKQASDAKKERGDILDAAKQIAYSTREYTNADSEPPAEEDAESLKTIDEVRVVHSEAGAKISEWTAAIESKEEELGKRRKEVDAQKKSLDEQDKMNKAIKERVNLLEEKNKLDTLEKSIKPMEAALTKHHDAERLKGVLASLVSAKAAVKGNEKEIDEHLKDTGMDASVKEKSPTEIKQLWDAISNNVKIVQDISRDQKSKNETSESLDGLVEAEKNARDRCKELLFQQHKAWASQIAEALIEGDPCLVCGSTKHPTPADGDRHIDSELEKASVTQTSAEDKLKGANVEISRLTDSIKENRRKLKLGEGNDIPDVSNLESERDAYQELHELKIAGVTLVITRDTSQAAWNAAENPHNLDSMEKIDSQILESDKMKDYTKAISDYNNRLAINSDGLERQEVIDAEGKKAVDIGKDIVTLEETTFALREDEQEHEIAKIRLSYLESSDTTLSTSIEEYTQFASSMADLQWVDNHIRGIQGAKMKMDIIAWILRRWFEAALANANTRLAEIGSGRYSLEMTQVGKDDGKTGLNIGVVDALSDSLKARSTNSLSGGESFYISLALALGMSDVVSEEAGGIRLGTLFIDEGFGTLDQDTLDDVMGVIDEIGENNRVIGLISHVESLKQRIPSRISVIKKGDGTSTTKVEV